MKLILLAIQAHVFVQMVVYLLVTKLLLATLRLGSKTNMLTTSGQQRQVRTSKRKKKPISGAARTVMLLCGRLIKLSLVFIVLYLCWLIYVAVYEGYFI